MKGGTWRQAERSYVKMQRDDWKAVTVSKPRNVKKARRRQKLEEARVLA